MTYSVGEMIKAYRKQSSLSQKQLADIVGITQPALSAIESGKSAPSAESLKLIANALKVTIDVLNSGVPSPIAIASSKNENTNNASESVKLPPLIQMPEANVPINPQVPLERLNRKQDPASEQPLAANPALPHPVPSPQYFPQSYYPQPAMMPIAYAPIPNQSAPTHDQQAINWPQRYFDLLDQFQQLQKEYANIRIQLALYEFKYGKLKEEN